MFRRQGGGGIVLENGAQVVAHGRISFFERRGELQLNVDVLQPAGVGIWQAQFERLKAQLEEEGLFDPQTAAAPFLGIGVVTSPTGAVFHDICQIVGRRWPLAEIVLAPTPVQGDQAAPGIVDALDALNHEPDIDVIILARGGGSEEELWPFNEEVVARAVYASRLPVVRAFCVGLIEVVRGVPLIAILFMAQVMLPMFLPMNVSIDRVLRAIAGMTIFTAAYLAEVIRGGLQAVPREQVEAARALGLSEMLVTGLVVLPQALRLVIPAIMGQFVSMFKDTTLVAIIGLLELLGILSSITKQREFLGTVREVYLVAAAFYFVICYAMSLASRRVETRLGVGTR
jgi:His/Glu/Gln/Arg/opine family amino acid ABC transporter permease subunit